MSIPRIDNQSEIVYDHKQSPKHIQPTKNERIIAILHGGTRTPTLFSLSAPPF
ncbi:MAG: hypothetical protein Q7J10_01570 [Methanosarcinaceae archaeon]|nr:hypothetical protein [Methanosarcinaceae archaeon]